MLAQITWVSLCTLIKKGLYLLKLHLNLNTTAWNKAWKVIFNNYSPQAKWILVNIPQDEVEGNIHQYSRAWGE